MANLKNGLEEVKDKTVGEIKEAVGESYW